MNLNIKALIDFTIKKRKSQKAKYSKNKLVFRFYESM